MWRHLSARGFVSTVKSSRVGYRSLGSFQNEKGDQKTTLRDAFKEKKRILHDIMQISSGTYPPFLIMTKLSFLWHQPTF